MVMSPEGTFDYVLRVPQHGRELPWQARLRAPLKAGERRLLGHSPILEFEDVSPVTGVLHTRLTLASDTPTAGRRSALSFCVDRALVRMLRPEDDLHISRSILGGIGLSVIRNGSLVGAAGAVMAVPLGPEVTVRTPWDLVGKAEAIFREHDRRYRMYEPPVQLIVGEDSCIIHRGRPRLGSYEFFTVHGPFAGMPGTDACMAIERRGVCPATAATLTALLLDKPGAVRLYDE